MKYTWAVKTCGVEGCTRRHYATGLCGMHYQRKAKHGDPAVRLVQPNQGRACTVEKCPRGAYCLGFCRMHYIRYKRHGDPSVCLTPEREIPGYKRMHRQVRAARGAPTGCPCGALSSEWAHEWAYDHSDPDELVENGLPYSLDVMRYQPRCVSCHRREDYHR